MRRNNGLGDTEVVLHRKPKIDTYEISASELDTIAQSSASDYCLEFGLCSLSSFVSCACALFVIDKENNPNAYFWYSLATMVTLLTTVVLLFVWYETKDAKKTLVKKIKSQPEPPSVSY